jgi:Domain of unknown function (DUF4411)
MADTYCIDTNIVIFLAQRMPRDVYPGPWNAIEALIAEGRATMPQEVYIELGGVEDECSGWAAERDGFVQSTTLAEIQIAAGITTRYPGWVSLRENAADPFVIAHAVVFAHVIVTDERRKGSGTHPRNAKIPNVADEYHVECVTFVELARREGWRFTSG